jgi:NifU-like protein involved in Fe-S cluster formation
MENPDFVGDGSLPGRGLHLRLYLRLAGERVAQARFEAQGCGPAIAAGSVLTEMIVGASIEVCGQVTAGELEARLGGLPAEKAYCAELAIAALRDALSGAPPTKKT